MSGRNKNKQWHQVDALQIKNTSRAIVSMSLTLAMCPLALAFQEPVLDIPSILNTIAPPQSVEQVTGLQLDEDSLDAEGVSTMLQGPLHEAFAEQFISNPIPGETIDKEPPQPINEVPPAFEPEGDNIEWIPGYWGVDIESQDFIWVTGIWRNVPPNQQWVPGYWNQTGNGWQWISGFWISSQTDEIAYLPIPPESLDHGPSSPAPGDDYFWVSGSWQYESGQYVWQAGQWARGNDDWIWVPSRYVWTTNGCIYRPGFWDYGIEDRGTVFCPVVFSSGYAQQVYRPNYALSVGPLLLANLFIAPGYHHYYYGNYQSYQGRQPIYPWVNYYQQTRNFDPLYSYYAYQRRNSNFIQQIGRIERQMVNNPSYRSQPTVFAQINAMKISNGQQANVSLHAATLASIANRPVPHFDAFHFKPVAEQFSKQFHPNGNPVRNLASDRAIFERDASQAKKNFGNPLSATQIQSGATNNSLQLKTKIVGRDSTHMKPNHIGNGNPLNPLANPNSPTPSNGKNTVDPFRAPNNGAGKTNGLGQTKPAVRIVPELPSNIQSNLPFNKQRDGNRTGAPTGLGLSQGSVPNNVQGGTIVPNANQLPGTNNRTSVNKPFEHLNLKPDSTPLGREDVNALKGMFRPGNRQSSGVQVPPIGQNNPQFLNQGQSNQGQLNIGQPKQGQPNIGQPNQGQPNIGQPNQGQPNQGQPKQGQLKQGQPKQGQPNQGQPNQGQPNQGQPNLGQPKQGQLNIGQPSQGQPNLGQSKQGQPNLGQPNQGQPNQGLLNQGRANQGQPKQGQPNQGQPKQGQPNQGQPNQGQPKQGQPNQGQPNQGQPKQGQSNQGQPKQGQPNLGLLNQGLPNLGAPNQGPNSGKNDKGADKNERGRSDSSGPDRPRRGDK